MRTSPVALILALAAIFPSRAAVAAETTCASPEVHAFDFLIGDWTGTNEMSTLLKGPPPGPTRLAIAPALGGCALEETWQFYPSAALERAKLWRAYDRVSNRWYLYFVNESVLPQVWDGRLEHGNWWFYRSYVRDGTNDVSRQAWLRQKDGFARRIERSRDEGKSWEVMYTADYLPSGPGADGAIRAAAMAYVDGRDHKNATLLRSAFSDSANLYYRNDGGDLVVVPVSQYVERVVGDAAAPAKADLTVDILEQTGSAAIVRVVNRAPGRVITDYLAMVKVHDAWKIAAKVFDRNLAATR